MKPSTTKRTKPVTYKRRGTSAKSPKPRTKKASLIERAPTSLPRPPMVAKEQRDTMPEAPCARHDTVPSFDDTHDTQPPPSGHSTYLNDVLMMQLQNDRLHAPLDEMEVIDRLEDLLVQSMA